MFFKFHTRRGVSKGKKEKESASTRSRGGIFRQQKGDEKVAASEFFPTIEAGITFSMSEDYEDSPVEIEVEDESVLQEMEPTITFTEKEVMRNELNHIRQLSAKQSKIHMLESVLEELKVVHAEKVAEKEEELATTEKAFETMLNQTEEELNEVRTELEESKNELTKVCSVLIGCQHDLHELQTKKLQSWLW